MSVFDHCCIVAEVAKVLFDNLPVPGQEAIGNKAVIAAALHDVGKVSPGFQLKYFRDALRNSLPDLAKRSESDFETDHARTGACAVWSHLNSPFSCPAITKIVAIHHGSIKEEPLPRDDGEKFGGPEWSAQRQQLIEALEKLYGSADTSNISPVACNCIAGLVTIADWIGSDETLFPPAGLPQHTSLSDLAANAVAKCGMDTPEFHQGLTFQKIFNNPPYPLQSTFADAVSAPGLYILEAPMGMGKTEAALYAAYKLMAKGINKGMFFGLPTRLTSATFRVTT